MFCFENRVISVVVLPLDTFDLCRMDVSDKIFGGSIPQRLNAVW